MWCRTVALVTRLSQAMFWPSELRLSVYVDDPLAAVSGTDAQRRRRIAVLVLAWTALGFRLQFNKAKLGGRSVPVTWTSTSYEVGDGWIKATVKEEIVNNVELMLKEFWKANVVAVKELKSFIGRCEHISSLIYVMRPFVAMLRAAVSENQPGAPAGCVWKRSMETPLKWIAAFLHGKAGTLVRVFTLEDYMRAGDDVEITLDASPWGLGGALMINGIVIEFFSSCLTDLDEEITGCSRGGSEGQQTWETLC